MCWAVQRGGSASPACGFALPSCPSTAECWPCACRGGFWEPWVPAPWLSGIGTKRYGWTSGSPAGCSQPGQVRAITCPRGGSQDKSSPKSVNGVFAAGFRGVVRLLPAWHPQAFSIQSERDKQTGSASLIYFLIQKRSGGGAVTLSRAQPALPLLTAQQRCLRTQIPTLSSLKAVKMYFLLCHFSFWQAGSQVGLENVKVGNKVVCWEKKKKERKKGEKKKAKRRGARACRGAAGTRAGAGCFRHGASQEPWLRTVTAMCPAPGTMALPPPAPALHCG